MNTFIDLFETLHNFSDFFQSAIKLVMVMSKQNVFGPLGSCCAFQFVSQRYRSHLQTCSTSANLLYN